MADAVVLPVKTIRNPRDLGGYVGRDGRLVRSGRLLRTGNISRASQADLAYLRKLGLTKISVLRSPHECELEPDKPVAGVEHINISVAGGVPKAGTPPQAPYDLEQEYAGFKQMCLRYYNQAVNEQARVSVGQVLTSLAETKSGAVLYHCSEGKDRTGMVTLVILYILGVDMETIRQDYLFSNYMLSDYRATRDGEFKRQGKSLTFRANMRTLGSVADAFFDTIILAIDEKFGGMNKYIREELGITAEMQETLCELYLEV